MNAKDRTIIELRQKLAKANKTITEISNENAKLKLDAFQRGENPVGKRDLGIDEFINLVQEAVGLASEHVASLFISYAERYEKNPELEDGDYEEIKDTLHALSRMTARVLGNPLANMDNSFLHDIELPDDQRKCFADNGSPKQSSLDTFIHPH